MGKKNKNNSKKAAPTSKAPSGLSIVKNGWNFTFKWTKGETYSKGQALQYCTSDNGNWREIGIKTDTTESTVTLSASNYYPSSWRFLRWVAFRVRGKANRKVKRKAVTWSQWTQNTFYISAPQTTSISYAIESSSSYEGTFTWSTPDDSNTSITNDTIRQTILVNSAQSNGAALNWNGASTAYGARNGSQKITENITRSQNGYVRWMRIHSRGSAGDTRFVYAYHAYGYPNTPTINSVTASNNAVKGINVSVNFSLNQSFNRPVDSYKIQYVLTVPNAGLIVPDAASWQDSTAAGAAGNYSSGTFPIDDQLDEDQCLFVRITSTHDGLTTYGTNRLAMLGKMKAPTISSITMDTSTNKVSVSVTNNSTVPDSRIAVILRAGQKDTQVGIIEHDDISGIFQCPDLSNEEAYAIGVCAFRGNARTNRDSMVSAITWKDGVIPRAPKNVTVEALDDAGNIKISWDWTWSKATGATISWSSYAESWESTEEPSTYTIDAVHASKWIIRGLDTGKTWYFRVRLNMGSGNNAVVGPWCDTVSLDTATAPQPPVLYLSDSVVNTDGEFTASWDYTSTDGTAQAAADICEATLDSSGNVTYGNIIATATTETTKTISVASLNWETGSSHKLCVRVTSKSGKVSERWSYPIDISVIKPLNITMTSSLANKEITDDADKKLKRTVLSLSSMPMTVTIDGCPEDGTSIVTIERALDFHIERPDGSDDDGYAGESIVSLYRSGSGSITITNDDLIGSLDDDATYILRATIKDTLGQAATASQQFEVHWDHQAGMPTATIIVNSDKLCAMITPVAPSNYVEGDTCDIYRLGIDYPELIVKGAKYGETYVDPYPAFGEDCGHRVVDITANGDYITEDNIIAWEDYSDEDGDAIYETSVVIDFDNNRVKLPYNVELSNSWAKDFKQTTYLGGSVIGDWNPSVTRKLSVSTDYVVSTSDDSTLQLMRDLAVYPGICHVRTPEGSSFPADVQVSETRTRKTPFLVKFSLTISEVDYQGFDGMTLEEWNKLEADNT